MKIDPKSCSFIPIGLVACELSDCLRNDLSSSVIEATQSLYQRNGYSPPWIGYIVVSGDKALGTCAFTSAPKYASDGVQEVEIAYYTFPEFEGAGLATFMASELIRIAREAQPDIRITAQTLDEENPSTSILRKLKFEIRRRFVHPEDGPLLEWVLHVC